MHLNASSIIITTYYFYYKINVVLLQSQSKKELKALQSRKDIQLKNVWYSWNKKVPVCPNFYQYHFNEQNNVIPLIPSIVA